MDLSFALVISIILLGSNDVAHSFNVPSIIMEERCEICKKYVYQWDEMEIDAYKRFGMKHQEYQELARTITEIICELIDMCSPYSDRVTKFYSMDDVYDDGDNELIEIPEYDLLLFKFYPLCSTCLKLTKKIIQWIEKSHERNRHRLILRILSQGCKLLIKPVQAICNNYMRNGSEPLINALAENLGPTIACAKVKLCPIAK